MFENIDEMVFGRLRKSVKRVRHCADVELDMLTEGILKGLQFQGLKKRDPGIKIRASANDGYALEFSRNLATDEIMAMLMADNPEINLTFDAELASFRPNAELVKKSKAPLWVLRQGTTSNKVHIERVW